MEEQKNDSIPKKIAALEVYKFVSQSNTIAFFSIAGFFIVAIFSVFNKWAGAISAGVLSTFYAFFILRYKNKMDYLEKTYGLEKAKPLISKDTIKKLTENE